MSENMLKLLDVLSQFYEIMPYQEAEEINAQCLHEVNQIFSAIDNAPLDELIAVSKIKDKLSFFRNSDKTQTPTPK